MKLNRTKKVVVATAAAFLVAPLIGSTAYAAKGDLGVDNSIYQGKLGNLGSAQTKFSIIQVGCIYNSSVIYPTTYATQVQYTIAQGKRAHSYVFLADGSNQSRTQTYMTQMLNKVQTPKGSIVAIDYESGATRNKEANTANVLLAMDMVKQAGYTPMLYSYKPYLQANLNTQEVLAKYSNSIWIASYKTTSRQTKPDFNYFPSFDGVNIWQFADNYGTNTAGVDGNVDMLGITDNGYNGTTTSSTGGTAVKTDSTTTAIKAGQEANNTSKSDIVKGDTVKVNFSASKWATGQSIPSFVKGVAHKVLQVSGNRVLLDGVLSWANKSDVEILSVGSPVTTSTATNKATNSTGTFNDSGYTIHRQSSTFTAHQTLRVFAYPGIKATGARYYRGESVKYDGYVRNGNYIYVSYLTKTGHHHYIAVRNANTRVPLGTFK